MKNEKKLSSEGLLEEIKALSKHKLTLFESNPQNREKDMLLVPLESYKEAMDLILYLLKTCIMSLQAEYTSDKYIGAPELCTSEVLKLITQLMPYEEMELLDAVHAMMKPMN
ncbi:hypothetical protein [Cellulophaga baltica]|uniref:Uncharacterized protein n=1 Tax=Cellulophaga baltica TaxID=76594 RepID=A0A1G7MBU2_9FLAO|nr:hypothetical protein [Cellulophaga baltica]SDF59155.1 hypothetical protein SAMN04487992_1414 [Cellulophaga baltica]